MFPSIRGGRGTRGGRSLLARSVVAGLMGVGSMSVGSLGVPLGSLAHAADAPVKVSENASRRFSQGVRYLTSQDPERYEKAYREFKAAYADSPSWKILGNLGIVAHELERDGEAIDAFRAYIEQGGKELSRDERKQMKEDLEQVEAGFATLAIETNEDGAWIVDERLPETGGPIVNRYGPTKGPIELRVRAGHHRIRAERNGFETDVWEFSNAPGERAKHSFDLRPARPPAAVDAEPAMPVEAPIPDARADASSSGSGLRIGSYVAFGLGAVGIGLGTYFLIDAYDKQDHASELYSECEAVVPDCGVGAPQRDEAIQAQEDENSAFQRSLISYVAGGAFAATGVVLLILSNGDDGSEGSASLTPWVGPSSVGLSGRF
jgi:hypothetical protein